MSGLTRKKVKVRGKNGRTFQRSVMVKSNTDSIVRQHWKTAAKAGFAIGAATGVGVYGGAMAGHAWGHRAGSAAYAKNKNSDEYHAKVASRTKAGVYAGGLGLGVGTAVGVTRTRAYKQMATAARSDQAAGGRLALIQQGASYVGGAAGALTAWGTHSAAQRIRERFRK